MESKTVLDLNAKDAKRFFLHEKNYFHGDLPPYFSFQEIINKADKILQRSKLSDLCQNKPNTVDNVNYDIVINKNNKYAWRKLTILNPILYVDLVNCICDEEHWSFLQSTFKQFKQNTNILCSSVPALPATRKKQKGKQVENWVTNFEKETIRQSIDFLYMSCTDISNCYPSIYTHIIPWALYGQEYAKQHRKPNENFGNMLDNKLSSLSYGQTNGIPQGSVLMDFIAEIVLGYADVLIQEQIDQKNINDYKILRYRDDYRVFTNNVQDNETIIKIINDICRELGFKLNSDKTQLTSNIIIDAVKYEKFFAWPECQGDKYKLFLVLYKFSKDFENTGTLQTFLNKLNGQLQFSAQKDDLSILLSIMVDIAYNSPKVIPQAFAIISKILKCLPESSRIEYIKRIKKKFDTKSYTDFVHIWLQRLSLTCKETIDYMPRLCKLLHNKDVELWNMSWLNTSISAQLSSCNLINKDKLKHISLPINRDEIDIFNETY